ncbi:7302_t:CDS:2 [Rhizophagus irregularis]|nr:7302_t:CDS:2 [Rhizophagus irregularis]
MEFGGGFTFDKEPCHPDNCSLFIGGDNLAEVDGKKFKIGQESEEELTIHFFPLVRKKQAEHKTVDSNYGPSHNLYNLYDDGLYVDDDDKVVIISGEYKNINIVEGNHCIKKLIPTGRFETKIPLPSRIDPTKKVKIEKVDAISLFKITFTKGEGYKKRRLSIE